MQANKNFFILIVGGRASGKSELTKKFITEINEMKQVDEYFIFCNSNDNENYCKNYVNIYNGYNNDVIENIIKKQIEDTKNNNSKHVLIILDDVLFKITHSKTFADLLLNANDCNISCILTTCYLANHLKFVNYDYLFFFKKYYDDGIYNYVKDFINFPNLQAFRHSFDKLEKFDYLMIKT
jgi:hypothetical protein